MLNHLSIYRCVEAVYISRQNCVVLYILQSQVPCADVLGLRKLQDISVCTLQDKIVLC